MSQNFMGFYNMSTDAADVVRKGFQTVISKSHDICVARLAVEMTSLSVS